jgi:hypothetical protein
MLLDHGDAIGKGTSPDWSTRFKKETNQCRALQDTLKSKESPMARWRELHKN